MPRSPMPESGPRRGLRSAFLLSVALGVLTLGFRAGIKIGSFRQSYAGPLISSFSVAGGKAAPSVEQAIPYGKVLDDFSGIETILAQVRTRLPQVERVYVAHADGRILYSDQGRVTGLSLTEPERRRA